MINVEESQILKNTITNPLNFVRGAEVLIGGENFYKISNVDKMPPFFISLISNSNHWLFISSNGGLTAGRKDSSNAFFPYYTDDKITQSIEHTGSKTIFRIGKANSDFLWEPFSIRQERSFKYSRNLYKNTLGNKIIFEEINHDLELTFSYEWNTSDRFGFVRKSLLINHAVEAVEVSLIDGLQNILPWGIDQGMQSECSNLADAYKKNELDQETGLGIYSLSALIVDKAEPSEALKANSVWSMGFDNKKLLLSSLQLEPFRLGYHVRQESDIRAEKGAYFINSEFRLLPKTSKDWTIVAEVNQDINQLNEIRHNLINNKSLYKDLSQDISLGSEELNRLVAAADGMQMTADGKRNIRHLSNTLFNIMRGGIFDKNYTVEKADFSQYLSAANSAVYKKYSQTVNQLSQQFDLEELNKLLKEENDPDFIRLATEYLPLKFSRRHGDPSRPWNKFSINTKNEIDGSKILDYEGNWRDIFQNWEALAHAYPCFIQGMIHKFLNATTFEGYNPYRLTKDGFDWETIEPDNPWSYIGYWGDHQVIYLLKFLEISENYFPAKLKESLHQELFVFANVPYKIKPVEELLLDPKNTIDFDFESHEKIHDRKIKIGADGALRLDAHQSPVRVSLIEKILIMLLAKISNFIPEGGIWMNTQRPEWNDANNALVGNGVSMVTLYYLRRFFSFFNGLLEGYEKSSFSVSIELAQYFGKTLQTFEDNESLLKAKIDDKDRKRIFYALAVSASHYRQIIYDNGHTGDKEIISKESVLNFIRLSLAFLDHTIVANKRKDQLYHSYNLVEVKEDMMRLTNLSEMLEGQVAVMSSGFLSTTESLDLLDSLRKSSLYREDQNSYLLYPDKNLPVFLEKNILPANKVEASPLLKKLLNDKNSEIISKDILGHYHFNADFKNVAELKKKLRQLPHQYQTMVNKESESLFSLYESVFNHKYFTGRSGTFFGYEGLGSIYWHMVSKLLLANYEVVLKAIDTTNDKKLIDKLVSHYHQIRSGIGVNKSPELYGAFPTDPYSHTPRGKGAQQPGMTGQVKEDLLSRWGEMGMRVRSGVICFEPTLLNEEEFFEEPQVFNFIDIYQEKRTLYLVPKSLAFGVCQVAVIYQQADENIIEVYHKDGSIIQLKGLQLNYKISQAIFKRSGEYIKIVVFIDTKIFNLI
jgi:hypothetical protein